MAGNTKVSKNNTSGKRKAGRPKKAAAQKANDNMMRSEVVLIVLFAVSVLLFLSNFHLCGIAGDFLRKIQLGLFGSVGFLVPVFLFAGTCFYLSNQGNLAAKIKFFALLAGFITICGFLHLFFGTIGQGNSGLLSYYQASANTGLGGGLFGAVVAAGLQVLVGKVGTYIILTVLLLICVVCVTEKSVVSLVKRGSGKAYHYAKEDLERRKILHEQRSEEKRQMKEAKKISGVDLQSTTIAGNYLPEDAQPMPAAASPSDSREPTSANIFSGQITLPKSYAEEMKEVSAQTAEVDEIIPSIAPVLKTVETVSDTDEDLTAASPVAVFKADDLIRAEDVDRIFPPKETKTLQEMNITKELFIPDAEKRVVTATGKIIETDTEMLQKKLEERRQENDMIPSEAVVPAPARTALSKTVPAVMKPRQQQILASQPDYQLPPLSLLTKASPAAGAFSEREYRETAIKLQQTLQNFGVGVTVTNISCGPSVTRYELSPEQGVKVSKIVGLTDDIKLSLAAADIRIEAPIPGKSAVGIEVPNKSNTVVLLRELLEADGFKQGSSNLSFAVGKDIAGQVVVTDIAKMPHLLIAGATGSGKSVCINTLIMSLIYKASPEDVKMIMIDPKVVELSVYNGIPHLLIPVVTDPKKAAGALHWAVAEMTDRYQKFANYNVRDLKGYNKKIEALETVEDEEKPRKLPQIVIIVDELADLMMVAPGEVEDAICRLAQLARAAGIHLVIATQRPSVNVITGLIKANVPSRIAFSVSSGVDSRTIIDMNGAEKLLGKGDMLFYPSGYQKPQRVQGAFVSDQEVSKVVEFLLKQNVVTAYQPDLESRMQAPVMEQNDRQSEQDEYFLQAGKFVIEKEKASIGMLQRVFKIGFNRAARIMDQLADAGVVGEEEGTKPRKVLMTIEEFLQAMNQEC